MDKKFLDNADAVLERNKIRTAIPAARYQSLRHDIAAAISGTVFAVTAPEVVEEVVEPTSETENETLVVE